MSIIRTARKQQFTIIDNSVFDSNLSYRAMGLLTFLLSKPDHWKVSVAALVNNSANTLNATGRDAIYATLDELMLAGFVVRETARNEAGRMAGVNYLVFDQSQPVSDELKAEILAKTPNKKPLKIKHNKALDACDDEENTESPLPANPYTVEPLAANPTQVNTDIKTNTEYKPNTDIKTSAVETADNFEAKPVKSKKQKQVDSECLRLAGWMFSKLLKLNPEHKKPNLDAWAEDIRLIRDRDNRTLREIAELFDFANNHDFWRTNILCPTKLRKQWDTLTIQKNNKPSGHMSNGQFDGMKYIEEQAKQRLAALGQQKHEQNLHEKHITHDAGYERSDSDGQDIHAIGRDFS